MIDAGAVAFVTGTTTVGFNAGDADGERRGAECSVRPIRQPCRRRVPCHRLRRAWRDRGGLLVAVPPFAMSCGVALTRHVWGSLGGACTDIPGDETDPAAMPIMAGTETAGGWFCQTNERQKACQHCSTRTTGDAARASADPGGASGTDPVPRETSRGSRPTWRRSMQHWLRPAKAGHGCIGRSRVPRSHAGRRSST